MALLPIGAYAPRWLMSDQHVNPEEAIMISRRCDAQRAIGIHWGVFRLSDDGGRNAETRWPARWPNGKIAPGCSRRPSRATSGVRNLIRASPEY